MKSEIRSELERVKYKDLEDMVYRLQLTYNEIIDKMDVRYFAGPTIGHALPIGIYEISDINLMLKSLLTKDIKLNLTIDDFRQRSNLTTNKTLRFFKKCFFYTRLGFTQSHSRPIGDFKGFLLVIPGSYKSDKHINITGIDKMHLKND